MVCDRGTPHGSQALPSEGTSINDPLLPIVAHIFVFGTLKTGFALHDRALSGVPCEGRYSTVERYPMFIAGRWYAPMMLNEAGASHHVIGELYNVDARRLHLIDQPNRSGYPEISSDRPCCAIGGRPTMLR